MTTQKKTARSTAAISGTIAILALLGLSRPADAVVYGGIDFPAGAISFADAVVSYSPKIEPDPVTTWPVPDPRWRDPNDALGIPNYTPPAPGAGIHNTGQFVSLGNGGSIVLEFTDNFLTGSDDAGDDLYIFEVGPFVEATFVEISRDGIIWHPVGAVGGATAGIDIDAYGFHRGDLFRYVRLTDDTGDWPAPNQYGFYAGADIDAVGAISTIPEPGTMALLAAGASLMIGRRKRQ